MIQFTEAQLLGWITPLLWPLLRVLALFSALPVIGQRSVPARVRVALAFLIAFCAQAGLPEMPAVPLDSGIGFMLVAQQVVIGLTLGFAVRIVFAAVEFAGELIGLQMGLNLAGFFDPATGGQATAVSRFFGIMVSWMFIVIGGHLLIIDAVVQSFRAFPAGPEPFAFIRAMRPEVWGAEVFAIGLWIAMPLVGMMLFVNLVLGLISRVAAQMNIFAIGFPITLGVGLIGIVLTLPMMQTPFTMALEKMLERFQ
ncbi:flagellar biosynthetic protein FliR [Aquincola tertiaricarbonis]|uniref:Flagellar biosynthetic protein FliR n=1 Tax=Aquincola tertiaricarbonis TaxID=391953 RepID=A0ABY4S0I4_AQUTE|nr:flagellar biosynthetic protein FliR [Aquincola tertiaricarbonis]URI05995.1 flagellar biosynthetic protein FliR [Aquincola tertiaricarbonis]